ncbi:MAG: beta-propeller domain-containing protein [Candidatus Micrarchaeota archaeon]
MNMKLSNLFLVFGFILILIISGCTTISIPGKDEGNKTVLANQELPRFASCSAISEAFANSQSNRNYYYYEDLPTISKSAQSMDAAEGSSVGYSQTNIQVAGVDEADFVKTDGKYIYVISNNKLHIAEAYPGEDAKIISTVNLEDVAPSEMFIDEDRLLVFGQKYIYQDKGGVQEKAKPSYYDDYYYYGSNSVTTVQIFDISDKEKPKELKTFDFEGNYLSSRKIGSEVYFILNEYPNYYAVPLENPEQIVPQYREGNNSFGPMAECGNVGYIMPDQAEQFVIVGSVSMQGNEKPKTEVIVASGENIYASEKNLYIAEMKYDYGYELEISLIPTTRKVTTKENTIVHKFSLDSGNVSYLGSMGAPGTILNQFSMDEYDGNFRIATTNGHVARGGGDSTNNLYIFGSDLKMKGKIEGIAPGERIYSTRFMGKKAYMVTFKKVDPLFVIDLSDAENPKILGKLKIPGYSDYLHPIDENHIIGIGKDTVEADDAGSFAWYQGIKMAVFDVTDVEDPKEMYKVIIGDRGTDSEALNDHKAFLYDKEKNLLVIPVLLAEIKDKTQDEYTGSQYGDYTFQGAYVYDLSLENGFKLKGRISHMSDSDAFDKSGYYYYDDGNSIRRSLYIGNNLYTISNNRIMVNDLSDLKTIKELDLTDEGDDGNTNDIYWEK